MDFDQLKNWDREDDLTEFRSEFHFPEKSGRQVIYFCGNSLGLQPKSTKKFVTELLKKQV